MEAKGKIRQIAIGMLTVCFTWMLLLGGGSPFVNTAYAAGETLMGGSVCRTSATSATTWLTSPVTGDVYYYIQSSDTATTPDAESILLNGTKGATATANTVTQVTLINKKDRFTSERFL